MNVLIEVTAEDLNTGARCNSHTCAVALAINRKLKPGYLSSVYQYGFGIYTAEKITHSVWSYGESGKKFPQVATDLVYAFDGKPGLTAHPTSFILDIPAEFLKEEAKETK